MSPLEERDPLDVMKDIHYIATDCRDVLHVTTRYDGPSCCFEVSVFHLNSTNEEAPLLSGTFHLRLHFATEKLSEMKKTLLKLIKTERSKKELCA